ncbi:MAG: sorbosone dehydrogenase family protein [Vulcanimicrobiaceae bacterium]
MSLRSFVRLAPFVVLALALPLGTSGSHGASAGSRTVLPTVPTGFSIEPIARISSPRELAVARNGDLFVGTSGENVLIVRDATGAPHEPHVFASLPDRFASGIALDGRDLYIGTYGGVWRVPYATGDDIARVPPTKIATVRPEGGRGHVTTSVALGRDVLYAGVGSSCNACDERDPTRATIVAMARDGTGARPRATHIRNPIALAVDPQTDTLWAGVAGQDELEHGHPYEIFDAVGAHAGTPDYGWPTCYENHRAATGSSDCFHQTTARVVFPAYETPIGAAFYDAPNSSAHAFPPSYRGGVFVALHGSWHTPPVEPRVAFVPLRDDRPARPVDWNDPTVQWTTFVGGFQRHDGRRIGRPTGVAVATDGSLFVADDDADVVYRIRPIR